MHPFGGLRLSHGHKISDALISDSYEAKGSIDNSGTLDIGTLKNASLTNKKQATIASAQSNITNEATGNLTVNVAYSGDALVNKGQATVESFTGKSLNNSGSKLAVNKMTLTNGATFTNTATTGATVGTLNVTNGSVSGAGNLAVTGKATIAATTTFDQNKLTAKDLAVAGTLTTTDLTVTGSLKNDKTITSTGNADLTNLTQNASGTTTLQVATLKGTGKIDGTLTAKDALTFADGSTYTGAGAITAQKALNVNGNVTMTNKVVAKGDTTIATGKALTAKGLSLQKANVTGTLSNQGAAGTIANLNMTAGAKLANNDTLTVDTLSAGTGVTYTQTGTTATLTTKDGSWFKNSTINLHGGQLDRVAHGLGTGNTYTVKATGANQIPGGNLNNDSWKNGMSILKVGTLTGENSVELLEGGLLEVKNLELDQNTMGGKTLTLNGGAIETTLEEMFEGVKVEALNYETVDGNGKIEVSGASVLGVSNIGTVQKSIKDHATLTGGDLVFNNSITVDQVSKVSEALNQVSGGNVTVHFTGQTDKVFTVDVANSLITANDPTKVVFDSSTLYARDTTTGETGKTLYVGGQDSDGVKLNGTIGFSNVVETEKVVIQDGKGLALVGKGDKNYGSLVGDNGSVDIKGENSELVLGTTYRQNLTGKLNTVNIVEGGKLLAKGGDYKVTTITANASSVETLAGGKVTTDALSVTGIGAKLNNKGTIVAKSFTDDQNTVSLNKGALEVGKATTLAGKMTNQTGGSIKVNGALTVTGKLVNEAASVNRAGATGIEVAGLNVTAGEAVVNSGVIKSTGVNTITGKSVNAMKDGKWAFANKKGGVVDFTAGKTTIGEARSKAAGQTVFYNEDGTVKFGDVHIERLAVLYNKATAEKGDAVIEVGNLTMDGLATLNNSGTILGNVTSNGTIRNSGTMAGKQFATYTSFAAREPSKNEINNTLVNASDGQIGYYDIVAVNGQLQNEGKVFAGELILDGKSTSAAVENGGKLINTGKADAKPEDKKGYVEADHTELKNGAQLIQTANGSFTSNTLTINDTSIIDINTGTFSVVESLDLLGGTVALKDVKSTINLKKAFEGSIALDSGELVLGYIGSKGESVAFPKVEGVNAVLVGRDAPLTIGQKGKLAVGVGAKDKLATMGDSSAWFGGDSMFVVNTGKLTVVDVNGSGDGKTVAALVGQGSLNVDTGAKIHFDKLGYGKYYVTKDFAEELLGEGSWEDNITYSENVGDKAVKLEQDENGNIIMTVVKNDKPVDPDKPVNPDKPGVVFPTTSVDNIIHAVIDDPDNRDASRTDVVGFINRVVEPEYLPEAQMVPVINEVAQIGAVGGVLNQGMTLVGNVMDQTERHLSYEDIHFKNGQLQTWDGVRFWANALGQKVDVSGADFTGGSASYDGENYGFIFGGDLATNDGFRFGGAFAYQMGKVDSKGGVVSTSNETDAYSLMGYAAKQFGQVNVIGSLGYTHLSSDVEQTLPGSMGLGAHTLKAKNDVVTAGVKGEMHFKLADNVAAVPYVGLRAVTVLSSDDTSKLGGKDAFHYDNDTLMQVQMPIGISFHGMNTMASGWMTRGVFDVSVTPVFGDKDTETTVSVKGLKATDKVTSDFADGVTGAIRIGYSAEKDNLSFGGELGVSVGEMRNSAVTFGLGARYRF